MNLSNFHLFIEGILEMSYLFLGKGCFLNEDFKCVGAKSQDTNVSSSGVSGYDLNSLRCKELIDKVDISFGDPVLVIKSGCASTGSSAKYFGKQPAAWDPASSKFAQDQLHRIDTKSTGPRVRMRVPGSGQEDMIYGSQLAMWFEETHGYTGSQKCPYFRGNGSEVPLTDIQKDIRVRWRTHRVVSPRKHCSRYESMISVLISQITERFA